MTFPTARRLGVLLAAGALAAIPSATAGADDPAGAPCADVLITDVAGDQQIGPLIGGPPGGPTNTKAPDNMDIRQVFFNTKTVDGKTVTTANIVVTKLDKSVPAELPTKRFSWFVDFDVTDGYTLVRAENDNGTITYWAATVTTVATPNGPVSQISGQEALKGTFVEGVDGVISIELPEKLAKVGGKLENVFATVSMRSDDENYVGYINDSAPDNGATGAKMQTNVECPAPLKTEPTVDPGTTQAPAAQPPAQPGQQTQSSGGQQPQTQRPATRPASKKKQSVGACKRKAKKIRNAKKRKAAIKRCTKKKRR